MRAEVRADFYVVTRGRLSWVVEGRFIPRALVTELRRPVQSLELYGDVLRSVEVRQFWGRLMPCKEEGHHLFWIARQEVGQRVHRFRSGIMVKRRS